MFSNSESHEVETVQCRFFASTLLKNTIYRNKEINCNHVSEEKDKVKLHNDMYNTL